MVKKYGDRVRAVPLDVTDESAAQAAVQTAVAAFGRLDVVVNNAGYGDIAPFEQLSAERFKAVMDTNFYGVVNVTRAAVPLMREQRSGCILQISSVGGRLTRPGSTPYHAAKWAVGGARANQDTPELLPDYEPSVGAVAKALKSYWGKEISDPAKVAQVVLRLPSSDHLPAHLLIGSDAVRFAAEAEKTRAAEGAQWRDVSLSTDMASATALPAMRF